MSRKISAILDHYVLIGNDTVEARSLAYIGVLEKNAILNNSSLAYLNTAEHDGILNGSLDHAALCDHGIGNLSSTAIACGRTVSNLCKNRTVLYAEESYSRVTVKKLH